MKLREVWVEKMAIENPSVSSYVSNKNEFDDGVKCYIAEDVAKLFMEIHSDALQLIKLQEDSDRIKIITTLLLAICSFALGLLLG